MLLYFLYYYKLLSNINLDQKMYWLKILSVIIFLKHYIISNHNIFELNLSDNRRFINKYFIFKILKFYNFYICI